MNAGSEFIFPQTLVCDGRAVSEGGLTKRELFAAMAMQGELASDDGAFYLDNESLLASRSVRYADALIAELNKEPK